MLKEEILVQDCSPRTSIYAVFDTVSKSNVQYFNACNDETAIRIVQDSARLPDSFCYLRRHDLVLYRLFDYIPDGESVLNRMPIYSLSALPEYDEQPFGIEKLESKLNDVISLLNVLNKQHQQISKRSDVKFLEKLLKRS